MAAPAVNWEALITRGVLAQMLKSSGSDGFPTVPIVQLLSATTVNDGPKLRMRAMLSDGSGMERSAIFASQMLRLQDNLKAFAVLQINNFIINTVDTVQHIFVIDATVLGNPGMRLGVIPAAAPVDRKAPVSTPPSAPVAAAPVAAAAAQPSYKAPTGQAYGGAPASASAAAAVSPGSHAAQPFQRNLPPPSAADGSRPLVPIRALNSSSRTWTIKARVLSKTDIKTFTSKNGGAPGKLFSMNLVDSHGGEIRCTCFGEAVDAFYPQLDVHKVYYIRGGQVKPSNPKFTGGIDHPFELHLDRNSVVEPCNDAAADNVPSVQFNFTDIALLPSKAPPPGSEQQHTQSTYSKSDLVDVLGVVLEAGDLVNFTAKNSGTPLIKRNIVLVDSSRAKVTLTLWGKQAQEFDPAQFAGHVLAVKGVKISSYNNCSLSALSSSYIETNPDISQAHALSGWWQQEGMQLANTFESVTSSGPGAGGATAGGPLLQDKRTAFRHFGEFGTLAVEQKEFYINIVTVMAVKNDTFAYPSCPQCKKKLHQADAGWRCESCNTNLPSPTYRYLLSLTAQDFTGQAWLQMFDEVAEKLLGRSANDLMALKEQQAESKALDEFFEQFMHQRYIIKAVAKGEMYQDRLRTRHTLISFEPLNLVDATAFLKGKIELMQRA